MQGIRLHLSLAQIMSVAEPARIPDSDWLVKFDKGEFDVFRERNRGVTVFSVSADGKLLEPTSDQLRKFMVKSLNWGTIDKGIFRPLMWSRKRFADAFRILESNTDSDRANTP